MPLFASKLLSPLQNVCGLDTTGNYEKKLKSALPGTRGIQRAGELGKVPYISEGGWHLSTDPPLCLLLPVILLC